MQLSHLVFLSGLVCALAGPAQAQTPGRAQKIAHGKYLVEHVGMCADCHTPRTPKGEFDTGRWLAGADLDFAPIRPMPWANHAPALAGLPGWTEAEMVRFLTTGLNLKGATARPPMPPYRLSKADAEAVAAYLKSLPAR